MGSSKILIIGGCPSVTGGVSCHIQRLLSYVKTNAECLSLDWYHVGGCPDAGCKTKLSLRSLFFKILKNRYVAVQIYSMTDWTFLLYILLMSLLFRFKLIHSIRNDRFSEEYNSLILYEKYIQKLYFYYVTCVVAVNRETDFLFINKKKINIIPGFIPPSKIEIEYDLPTEVNEFIDKHEITITTNASKLCKKNGLDLYGADLAIDLLNELRKEGGVNVGLLFVIPHVSSAYNDYYRQLTERVHRLELVNDFLFWRQHVSYPAILMKCDVSLRLTSSDGDSSSIREALSLGKPVVASDAAPRPVGTITFRSRDLSDLVMKVAPFLSAEKATASKAYPVNFEDNALKLIMLWKRVLGKSM